MAIEDGTISGWRVTGTAQSVRGLKVFKEYFEESFGGTFTGIVVLPLKYRFRLTDGPEPYEGGHISCDILDTLTMPGRQVLYGPTPLVRGKNYGCVIASLGGFTFPYGINIRYGEAPVQISLAPCGPIPRVFFADVPLTAGSWNGNSFGVRR